MCPFEGDDVPDIFPKGQEGSRKNGGLLQKSADRRIWFGETCRNPAFFCLNGARCRSDRAGDAYEFREITVFLPKAFNESHRQIASSTYRLGQLTFRPGNATCLLCDTALLNLPRGESHDGHPDYASSPFKPRLVE